MGHWLLGSWLAPMLHRYFGRVAARLGRLLDAIEAGRLKPLAARKARVAKEKEEPGEVEEPEEGDDYDLMKAEFEAKEELREAEWRQGIESALTHIAHAVAQSQAPKRVIRDEQGRVVGVEPISGGIH